MKRPPKPLTRNELDAMLKYAKSSRDRALIILLWRGGLRSAEVRGLDVTDLQRLEDGGLRIHIRSGKGGVARFVALDPRSAVFVRRAYDRSMWSGPVIRTQTGARLCTSSMRKIIARIGLGCGIPRAHPHGLRHSCARDMHEEGFSVREIQVAFGHKSLQTTAIYLQSIGCHEVVEKMAERKF
jgi:integrase